MALALAGCGGNRNGPRPGDLLPDLALTSLDGRTLATRSLRGRVLVLNTWATWCPPCRREMPALQRLSDAMDATRVTVAGLTVDRDLNLVREFLLAHRVTFPQYVDPDMALANGVLRVVGFPETFVLAPDGRLAARVVGERAWDAPEMARALQALARGEPAQIR
ncbi:MAG TPA: TlpA disulfide reductase family protein [Burkholderiales bacterium]